MNPKETYYKRKDAGLCIHCGKSQATHGVSCEACCVKRRKQLAGRTSEQKEIDKRKKSITMRKSNQNLKIASFATYGTVCQCCGESDIRFLTIDHINGDGAKQKREIFKHNGAGSSAFYHWLKINGYPEGFQVLCFNCNSGRSVNGGVCPHKDKYNEGAIK